MSNTSTKKEIGTMNQFIAQQIDECENRLKQAMLNSDVNSLDELLASELVFTNHLGRLMSKQDDLQAHRSGMLKIAEIALSDQKIKIIDSVAIVSVQAHIVGSFAGTASKDDIRFTRVWSKTEEGKWQVIAAHSSLVA
jgi:ketosteroid isomerase-like protein